MNLYEAALKVATKAHKGQTRWNGEPYITHPIAVAEAMKYYDECTCATAVLHDVIEDTDYDTTSLFKAVSDECFGNSIPNIQDLRDVNFVIQTVSVLSKKTDETYRDYIMRLKTDWGMTIPRAIKIADLKHNLSDLKPGQRRDKYELALTILET